MQYEFTNPDAVRISKSRAIQIYKPNAIRIHNPDALRFYNPDKLLKIPARAVRFLPVSAPPEPLFSCSIHNYITTLIE